MGMRLATKLKIAAALGLIVFGGVIDGSWKGSAGWAMVLFFGWIVYRIVRDDEQPRAQSVYVVNEKFQRAEDFTDEAVTPARRGQRRHPDPTRPTEDDYMGLAIQFLHRRGEL
jgi:hypothetical protein